MSRTKDLRAASHAGDWYTADATELDAELTGWLAAVRRAISYRGLQSHYRTARGVRLLRPRRRLGVQEHRHHRHQARFRPRPVAPRLPRRLRALRVHPVRDAPRQPPPRPRHRPGAQGHRPLHGLRHPGRRGRAQSRDASPLHPQDVPRERHRDRPHRRRRHLARGRGRVRRHPRARISPARTPSASSRATFATGAPASRTRTTTPRPRRAPPPPCASRAQSPPRQSTPSTESISRLDHEAMDLLARTPARDAHAQFAEYLARTKNTICGRHPIGVLLGALAALEPERTPTLKWVRYAQSNPCLTIRDSSVSYASAYVSF
ncbi:hypothetical protein DFH09DRAFT_1123543 [Mycena vulgaris]|nr:hypothetical protein DFH09DRAFT_1123543 [Mycena vulgaris]